MSHLKESLNETDFTIKQDILVLLKFCKDNFCLVKSPKIHVLSYSLKKVFHETNFLSIT